jgi:hypothetical protein
MANSACAKGKTFNFSPKVRWKMRVSGASTRVKIEKINNLLQVDIDRREQGCAAHYEQYCQHVVTALFNCNNLELEQHG